MSDKDSSAGPFGADPMLEWRRQFETFARQYQDAWTPGPGRGATGGAMPAWHEGLEMWARMTAQRAPDANDVLERFSQQSRGYFDLMRAVAERMQGDATASDVTAAWREAMSATSGGNAMLEALTTLSGSGARGLQQLGEGVEAMLGPLRGQADAWLGMPTFGIAREHQQHAQQGLRDVADHQAAVNRYNALLLEASEQAFVLFERKLAERSEPGRQVDSARALYDLWIDAAEEAYAAIALSPRFRDAYGAMVNAQMRVRQNVQRSIERSAVELDLPTRSELDSAHRRVHALQRELRTLRNRLDALDRSGSPASPARDTAARPKSATARTAKAAKAGSRSGSRTASKASGGGASTATAPKSSTSASKQVRKPARKPAAKPASKKAASSKTAKTSPRRTRS